MSKEILSFLLPSAGAVLALAAMVALLWAVTAFRARRRAKAINEHTASDEVVAATNFWYCALMRDWDRERPLSEDQLNDFRRLLPRILATAYVNNRGSYPEIGVAYHQPHNYGVDRYLRGAAGQANMPCGQILQSMLPAVVMRFTPTHIAVRRMIAEEWTFLWRKGEEPSRLLEIGTQYRRRQAAA